jgi:hypothetical protein
MVTLTFDDALDTHLDIAIPLLNEMGLKGTFYVNISSQCLGRRTKEWHDAALKGHELGNHTIFHPALCKNKWVTEGNAIENYTINRMRIELEAGNNVLQMIDGKTIRTFAFPCSNPRLGRKGWTKSILTALRLDRTRLMSWVDRWHLDFGSMEKDYTTVVKELFFSARCGGLPVELIPSVPSDRYQVKGIEADGLSTNELLSFIDKTIERKIWTVLVFHGIGGGHSHFCELEPFRNLLRRLAFDPRIVVKTFLDASMEIWG